MPVESSTTFNKAARELRHGDTIEFGYQQLDVVATVVDPRWDEIIYVIAHVWPAPVVLTLGVDQTVSVLFPR